MPGDGVINVSECLNLAGEIHRVAYALRFPVIVFLQMNNYTGLSAKCLAEGRREFTVRGYNYIFVN
ncbi:MAG: hypothetical protein OXB94_10695 [Nitrospira sp.]|nr:hypothetical protein [Nitrospira sp.]